MAPELADLLDALPEEFDQEESAHAKELRNLLRPVQKPVPISRLGRMWTLGTMKAKIAAAYLAYWIRSSYAPADKRQRLLNETHLRAAIKLLGSMSYMRGMIMKVGQQLAQYPDLKPRELAETLGKLCFSAPPMHYSLLREHLFNELGDYPEVVFDHFDRTAFAAASLGQVHRATLKSGELVAVKVQYPNIARTIEADFKNMMAILTPMRLTADWDNIKLQWDDVRQMLTWETDYRREAQFQVRARAVYQEQDDIVVPRVYPEYSTERVITMDYVEGLHIDPLLDTQPTQQQRDRYGELIMRHSWRLPHSANLWYSDSNPGNYLFLPDGRLGVLDFGCCREFSDDEWDYYYAMARAFLKGDEALRRVLPISINATRDEVQDPDYLEFLVRYARWTNEYLDRDEEFDFDNTDYMQRGIDLLNKIGRKRYFRSKPVNTWINRQLLGIKSLLYRLKARFNARRIAEQECPQIYAK